MTFDGSVWTGPWSKGVVDPAAARDYTQAVLDGGLSLPERLSGNLADTEAQPRHRRSGITRPLEAGSKKRKYAVKYDAGVMQQKHLSRSHAKERLEKPCCSNNCLLDWTIEDALTARLPYWSGETPAARDKVLAAILSQREVGVINDGGKGYILQDKHLCMKGLVNVMGISKKTLYRQIHVVVHNRPEAALRGNAWRNRSHNGGKRSWAVGWLATYTSLRSFVGDWQPDKEELHLAHSQKKQIYRLYAIDMDLFGDRQM